MFSGKYRHIKNNFKISFNQNDVSTNKNINICGAYTRIKL